MKNTLKAFTLAAIVLISSTFTFAAGGILVSDRKEDPCAKKDGIIVFGSEGGIIVFGSSATGIIVFGADGGIIVFGKSSVGKACTETDVKESNRAGILVSD